METEKIQEDQALKLENSTSVRDAVMKLSEGNPGAISVMNLLFQQLTGSEAFEVLAHLDAAGIYGPDIWVGYRDVCKDDIFKFVIEAKRRTFVAKYGSGAVKQDDYHVKLKR